MSRPNKTSVIQALASEFSISHSKIAEWFNVSRQYAHRKAHAGEYESYADTPWKDRSELERDTATRIAWQIINEEELPAGQRKVRNSYRKK